MATPAPGHGSLTVWMDRRGMRSALSTPARNDLRVLWEAAREVSAFKSGEGCCCLVWLAAAPQAACSSAWINTQQSMK